MSHAARLQLPIVQPGVPLATKQSAPHPPQWLTSPAVFVSQPLIRLPSQLSSGAVHIEMPQTPLLQAGVPPEVEHSLLQAPQWSTCSCVLTSQPLPTSPSQFSKPWLQLIEQAPSAQLGVPLLVTQASRH